MAIRVTLDRILLERRDAVLGVQRGSFVEQLGGRQAWVLQADGLPAFSARSAHER
jgi:hypothetical protein